MVRISREETVSAEVLYTALFCHRFHHLCLLIQTHLLYRTADVSFPKHRTHYQEADITIKHHTVLHSFPDMSFFSLFLFPQRYHAQERAHLAPCYRISIDAFSPQTSSSQTCLLRAWELHRVGTQASECVIKAYFS